MAEQDRMADDGDSIFDEEPEAAGSAPAPVDGLAAVVAEFLPLDGRRVSGDPPLTPAEEERRLELREWLEYEFGVGNPPLGGSQRGSLRVPSQLKVRVRGAKSPDARLANLSAGGAFLATDDVIAPGSRLELEIERDGAPAIAVSAEVRWGREIANMDGPCGAGIAFADVDDDTFLALERLVHDPLRSRARPAA